ncbi:type IV pili methyl-accepting chemotaxis transducer N-terminal domain-containing protein [endosymbiont of Lamellibrachia barhami]|uniref:type IV pili methyl-accepting chemotaxis transducer N-terminal domain-containing protein n=1 Tax=endosymbiont of Lamellibrachia barhami TaxID=205975 RepID=UPI0015A9D4C3|nr:type IV pili methyl-accepting chemotaxis transducer N-terminal domain-containing protein [endosymbiont of Lamellibrachia barhami]
MMTILGLAVISMLISVFVAETTEGFAAAINQAGTLRMQSYRIASSLVHGPSDDTEKSVSTTGNLITEFEERLFSPPHPQCSGERAQQTGTGGLSGGGKSVAD